MGLCTQTLEEGALEMSEQQACCRQLGVYVCDGRCGASGEGAGGYTCNQTNSWKRL